MNTYEHRQDSHPTRYIRHSFHWSYWEGDKHHDRPDDYNAECHLAPSGESRVSISILTCKVRRAIGLRARKTDGADGARTRVWELLLHLTLEARTLLLVVISCTKGLKWSFEAVLCARFKAKMA